MEKINVEDIKVEGVYCMIGKKERIGRKWVIKVNEIANYVKITWWFLEGGEFSFKENGIGDEEMDKNILATEFNLFKLNKKETLKFKKCLIIHNLK